MLSNNVLLPNVNSFFLFFSVFGGIHFFMHFFGVRVTPSFLFLFLFICSSVSSVQICNLISFLFLVCVTSIHVCDIFLFLFLFFSGPRALFRVAFPSRPRVWVRAPHAAAAPQFPSVM